MRLRCLADLRQDVRLRADVLNAVAKFPDTEINEYISQSWTKVYGFLATTGENYYLTKTPFSTVNGQDTYSTTANTSAPAGCAVLPLDLWELKGLDVQDASGVWRTCQRSQFEDRNDYQRTGVSFAWPLNPKYDYRNTGNIASIVFNPIPDGVYAAQLWYIPACPRLLKDTDAIDGLDGFERMAVDIAARWIAERDENFELAARLDLAIAEWEQRLTREGTNRNLGQPPKLRRSPRYKRSTEWWPSGRS